MGIEAWERLRREGARRGGCVVVSAIAKEGLLMDVMWWVLLPLLDHEPVLLAFGLSPVDERDACCESDEPEIRGRLLRLKEEGGPWEEPEVPDTRWADTRKNYYR